MSQFNFEINDTDATDGAGGGLELQLQSDGTLVISSNLTEGSSRLGKENFIAVDGQALLARLEALPITSWNYKTDAPDERHIGPAAEDFYAAFGLGFDDRHIAPLDTAGVALAAIKAQQAEITALRESNSKIQERLSALEELVSRLLDGRG